MARLIMRRGPTPGAVYELTSDTINIGRGSQNDIIIRDNEVSREHCRLVRKGDEYELSDLNSSNGTFVHGQPVTNGWLLQPGCIIELGDTITLEYEHDERMTARLNDTTVKNTVPPPEPPPSQDTQRYCLVVLNGNEPGRIYPLDDPVMTMGRDLSNDIVIQDPEVSRYHLRLRRFKQGYIVEDVGSTNGTYVNGQFLTEPQALQFSDTIKLGTSVQLQYASLQPARITEINTEQQAVLSVQKTDIPIVPRLHNNNDYVKEDNIRKTRRILIGLEPGGLHDHVFIAYARDEWEAVVAPLTISLQDTGLNVWVDQYLPLNGDQWREAVEQALEECWLMVVVVSPNAITSNYVTMQYRHFLNRDKPVIPLIYKTPKMMPPDLMKRRLILYNEEDPKKSFHKLIFEILQLRR